MFLSVPNHVQITELDGKYMLLDCERNYFYAVSKSGAQFLDELKVHGSMEKAISAISSSYRISQNRVAGDMSIFLNRLIEKGLVVKR